MKEGRIETLRCGFGRIPFDDSGRANGCETRDYLPRCRPGTRFSRAPTARLDDLNAEPLVVTEGTRTRTTTRCSQWSDERWSAAAAGYRGGRELQTARGGGRGGWRCLVPVSVERLSRRKSVVYPPVDAEKAVSPIITPLSTRKGDRAPELALI